LLSSTRRIWQAASVVCSTCSPSAARHFNRTWATVPACADQSRIGGSLGSVMLGVAAAGMLLACTHPTGWVGVPSIALLVLYLISVRMIAQFELRRRAVLEQEAEVFQYRHIKRSQAYLRFVLLSGDCDRRVAGIAGQSDCGSDGASRVLSAHSCSATTSLLRQSHRWQLSDSML